MRRYLVYTSRTGVFSFLDELDWEMAVVATIGSEDTVRQYGLWEFPDGLELLTFTAAQLTDALNWANVHGERIFEPV